MDIVLVLLVVVAVAAVVWLAGARARERAVRTAVDTAVQGRDEAELQRQLQQLAEAVQRLGRHTAQQFGEVDRSLRSQVEVTQALYSTTNSLREALANTNARGQWGERMADDVLRLAGLLPNVNYQKHVAVAGEGRSIPDFTFFMPDQHVMFMDVKFPIDSYLASLRAGTEAEKAAHRDAFLRAVRGHVRELARRDYAQVDARPAVDNVLMFVPNESIVGFIHEHAPTLVDDALRERVVLCSPLTLFAFLGVIRQAFDNFRLEQTSREMLGLLGQFGVQWKKYQAQVDRVRKQVEALATGVDELAGPRRRQLERPLQQLDELRREQHVEVAGHGEGELFGLTADDHHAGDHPGDRSVDRLGA